MKIELEICDECGGIISKDPQYGTSMFTVERTLIDEDVFANCKCTSKPPSKPFSETVRADDTYEYAGCIYKILAIDRIAKTFAQQRFPQGAVSTGRLTGLDVPGVNPVTRAADEPLHRRIRRGSTVCCENSGEESFVDSITSGYIALRGDVGTARFNIEEFDSCHNLVKF